MVSTGNKTLFLIIVFLSLFAIFSSSLFVNKGSSQGLGNFLDRIFGDDGDDQGEHGDDGDDQGQNGDDGNRGNREIGEIEMTEAIDAKMATEVIGEIY